MEGSRLDPLVGSSSLRRRDAYSIARRRADQAFGPDARRRVGEEVDRRERVDSDRECGTPSSVRRRHLRFRRGPTPPRPRTRTALAALGAADGKPLPWIVNGVPGSIDAVATEIDLTDSTLGVPGALALGRARVTPDHDSLRTLRLDRSTLGTEGGVVPPRRWRRKRARTFSICTSPVVARRGWRRVVCVPPGVARVARPRRERRR